MCVSCIFLAICVDIDLGWRMRSTHPSGYVHLHQQVALLACVDRPEPATSRPEYF